MFNMQQIFFRAMANGYAAAAPKGSIKELPGSKTITRTYGSRDNDERWRVVDCWLSNGDKSSGTTTIWFSGEPVWIMHYGGWYFEEALPFLKECLHRAYVTEEYFYGGRGPVFVRGDRFTYVNRYHGMFAEFHGEEGIFDFDGKCAGFHWYRGMSLASGNE